MKGQGVRPEIVCVSGCGGFSDKANVTARGCFFSDSAMGRDDFRVVRNPGGAIFECHAQRKGELLFHCQGEGDRLDLIGAETFLCAFDELPAEAGVIDARPAQRRQSE